MATRIHIIKVVCLQSAVKLLYHSLNADWKLVNDYSTTFAVGKHSDCVDVRTSCG